MVLDISYYEATAIRFETQFLIEAENDVDNKPFLKSLCRLGTSARSAAVAYPDDTTYVFRKMAQDEFNKALINQSMPPHHTNPFSGEKWFSESLQHMREFKNKGVSKPEVVAEFSVDKGGYKNIRDQAIPQKGSSKFQPEKGETGDFKNIYNKERLGQDSKKINIGLKGEKNVNNFNKYVTKVTKTDPNSFVNRSRVLRWMEKNRIRTVGLALGIVIEGRHITISFIEDGGRIGKSTQIELGKIAGAQIGAALGTVVPGIGNVILGFLGGVIGSLVGEYLVEKCHYLLKLEPIESEEAADH